MNRTVHIVAVGARTPVGLSAESSAAAVRAGISRVSVHPFIVNLAGEPLYCAIDGRLEPERLGSVRVETLLESALHEVVHKLTRKHALTDITVPVWLGLPLPRPGCGAREQAAILSWLREQPLPPGGCALTFEPVPEGHAAAFLGTERALHWLSSGKGELCLVLAGESYIDPETLLWFDAQNRLRSGDARSSFAPGEGAACLALASEKTRARLGLPSLGVVRAVGTAVEPNTLATGKDNLGRGLTQAIALATSGLDVDSERISDVLGDFNGERHRTEEWGLAALRTQEVFEDVSRCANSTAEWGDQGAASGALSLVLAVQAWQRRYAHGRHALAWGSSDNGLCGACWIEEPRGGA